MTSFIRVLLLLAFASVSMQVIAASAIDSLRTKLSFTHNDSVYVDILNQLSKLSRWEDPVMAMDYAVKAEKLSQANGNSIGLASAYHNMGAIYADKTNNELALEYHFKSLRIKERVNNKKGMANSYGNIGLIYRRERKFEKALQYHNKSLEIKKQLDDSVGIAYSYGNIGLVYYDQNQWDKALLYFYNSLRIKESMNDQYGIANSYGNIGVIYLKISNEDQARINLERALSIFLDLNNKTGIAESQLYLGDIYVNAKEYPQAIDAFNSCLNIYKDAGNLKGMADSYIKLGNIYSYLGKSYLANDGFLKSLEFYTKLNDVKGMVISKFELAEYYLEQNQIYKAKSMLDEAFVLAKKEQLNEEEYKIVMLLSDIAFQQKDYKSSAIFMKQSRVLADTIYNDKVINEVAQVQMNHEFDKLVQKREFEEQRRFIEHELKITRIRQVRNISIIAFVIVVFLLVVLYRNMKLLKANHSLVKKQKVRIAEHLVILKDQKDQLEKATLTKDKFLSIIGHDLKHPFNAINSFVSLIIEQFDSLSQKHFMSYIRLIKDAGANANSLLDNLLEWAMNQSGDLEMNNEEVSLNYILRGNLLLIKEMASQKNIKLIQELNGNPIVVIDKNMINTVVRNLISNALKFTPDGGRIIVRTDTVEDEVRVSIKDTGIGISDEQMLTLFEPGVAKLGKDGVDSSGLGLILSIDFLQKHKQELRVESTINTGTTFWFKLPLTKQ